MKVRILIVEDEFIVAMDLAWMIEDLGYLLVGTAHDGNEAIDKALSLLPDIILMDINLGPGMDGIDTALAIMKKANIPVIFCSAHSAGETQIRARASNPYGFIVKPYNDEEIKAVIEQALERHGTEMAERASTQGSRDSEIS